MYTVSWIDTNYQNEDNVQQVGEDVSINLFILNLSGCLILEDSVVEEVKLNVFTMSFLDLECQVHSNYVPKLILVPFIGT